MDDERGPGTDAAAQIAGDDEAKKPGAPQAADSDLSVLDASARVLDGVERALDALDAGTYGRCETCGAPIDDRTLASDPLATRCAGCAPA